MIRILLSTRLGISIHALLAESDTGSQPDTMFSSLFLSTLSLRRATAIAPLFLLYKLYFYPRSPCGERRGAGCCNSLAFKISIHALLAESDSDELFYKVQEVLFLSTLSLRRATCHCAVRAAAPADFYPRSPCGERPALYHRHTVFAYFYPRSPCGERLPEAPH